MTLLLGQLFAAPVDIETAKQIGEKFIKTNVASLRDIQESTHIKTYTDDSGNACLYIFNVGNKGYYIVSADDRAKPVLAYSDEGAIDINNIPSSMEYYLNRYVRAISDAIERDLPAGEEITKAWELVKSKGDVTDRKLRKSVSPLIDLLWNQDYPYNYYCPTAAGGPGGRVYVGCAADAMAMVMKFWNYPEAGKGEHTYTPEGFPQQSVTFGEAYDWDNMPIQINASSPQNQIQAIAKLMYHCGVSIDMMYGAGSSGAFSQDVPEAMASHFQFTDKMELHYKESFTEREWEDLLIANFDQGFPAFYAGHTEMSGGHAFVCDGYTENRYFHFNWGWSGSGNGNYSLDALDPMYYDFSDGQNAIFDMIPDYAYDGMPKAPEVEITVNSSYSHKSKIVIEVPEKSVVNAALASIDRIVVNRDGVEVFSQENVTPGSVVTFEDEVSSYDGYAYDIYAVNNGVKGRLTSQNVFYGPGCEWKLIATTTSFQGWNGAILRVINSNDKVIKEITSTTSTPVSETIQMPEGDFTLKWIFPTSVINNISLKLKDYNNETVYEYSGSSSSMQTNLYHGENDCINCQAPENLSGEYVMQNGSLGALISWDRKGEPDSYKIYRSTDNDDYDEIATVSSSETQYFDVVEAGGYYYQVRAYNGYSESMPAATADNDQDFVFVNATSIKENAIDAKVYPNPTDSHLNIVAEGMSGIVLYNTMGQVLIDESVDADEFMLDLRDYRKGVYMLRIISRQGESVQSIILTD